MRTNKANKEVGDEPQKANIDEVKKEHAEYLLTL